MRQTASPRQPLDLNRLRRLSELLRDATEDIEAYLRLGKGPHDEIPIGTLSLALASDYLVMFGYEPDAKELLKSTKLFCNLFQSIVVLNASKNMLLSPQEVCQQVGATDIEIPAGDTQEQMEEELKIRWDRLHDTALRIQGLLNDLQSHVAHRLKEHGIDPPNQVITQSANDRQRELSESKSSRIDTEFAEKEIETIGGAGVKPATNAPLDEHPHAKKGRPQTAHLRAAASYNWACEERPDLIPTKPRQKYSRKQWQYIKDSDCPAYCDDTTDVAIPVPAFETWKRQVRAGLVDPGDAKASSRVGRHHGKSIIRLDQI